MSKKARLSNEANRAASSTTDRYAQLVALGRSSYVSKSGIEKLLRAVNEAGLPDAFSRSTQYRGRKAICNTETRYGKLIQGQKMHLEDCTEVEIGVQNLLAFLHYNIENSNDFSRIIEDAIDRYTPSVSKPWNIVLYQDGVDPSDGLSKHHTRNSNVFYWSFLELGMRAPCHEECWGTLTLMRTTFVKQKN